jgi:hypothetical protein
MHIPTLEETYEYRITRIIKRYLEDNEVDIKALTPDELEKALWDGKEQLGELLVEDLSTWMGEDDWIKALGDES